MYLSSIILLNLFLITVFNRWGAGLGIGAYNSTALFLVLSIILFLANLRPIQSLQFPVIAFLGISTLLFIINVIFLGGLQISQFQSYGLLAYPLATLSGFILYIKPRSRALVDKSLNAIFLFSTIYALSFTFLRSSAGSYTLGQLAFIPLYGSYYVISIYALIRGLTFPMSLFFKQWLIYSSAIAIILFFSRNALVALALLFLGYFVFRILVAKDFRIKKGRLYVLMALSAVSFLFLQYISGMYADSFRYELSFDGLINVFNSLFTSDSVSSLSGSRNPRLEMWSYVIQNAISSSSNFFLGIPPESDIVEASFLDPHNGYLSLLSRGGVFALVSFLYMNIFLLFKSYRLYSRYKSSECLAPALFVLSSFQMIFFTTFLNSPMIAIPYYFLLGYYCALCISFRSSKPKDSQKLVATGS